MRVPEYTLAETFEDLPEQDRNRLSGVAQRICGDAAEAVAIYEDTWVQTLHHDLLGEPGQSRASNHLGYMIRSITPILSDLDDHCQPDQLLDSEEVIFEVTRELVTLEDYLAATADFVHWSDQDHERFSGLQSRVYTTTGALRQAIESTRALVIRHPEYDVGRWREKATKGIDLQ